MSEPSTISRKKVTVVIVLVVIAVISVVLLILLANRARPTAVQPSAANVSVEPSTAKEMKAKEALMGRVQTELEQVIDRWCQAEPATYGPTDTLKGLWLRKHPTSPKYNSTGIKNLIREIDKNEFFHQCDPPNIKVGSFVPGGAIQTVEQLNSFLDPCGGGD